MTNNGNINFGIVFESDPDQALEALREIRAGLQAINPDAKAVTSSVEEVNEALKQVKRVTDIKDVADGYAELAAQTDQAVAAQKDMTNALEQQGATTDEIAAATARYNEKLKELVATEEQQRKALSVGQRTTLTRSLLSNARFAVSDINRGDFGGAVVNATQAATVLNGLGVSLSALAAPAIALTAVLGTLAILFAGATKIFRDGSAEIDQALKSLDAYYAAIDEGTTQSIKAEIDKINRQKGFDQQYLEQISRTQQALRTGSTDALDAAGKALVSIFGTDGLRKKAEELSTKINDAEFSIVGLTSALQSNEVATNDAIAAAQAKDKEDAERNERQKAYDAEQKRLADEALSRQVNAQANAIQSRAEVDRQLDSLKKTASVEQVDDQITALDELVRSRQAELEQLYLLPKQTEQTQATIASLEQQIADWDYEIARLDGDVKTAAQSNDAYRRSIESLLSVTDEISASQTYQNELLKTGNSEKLAETVQDIESRKKILETQRLFLQQNSELVARSAEAQQKLKDINAELETLGRQRADIDAVKSLIEVKDVLAVIGETFQQGVELTKDFADETEKAKQEQYEKEAELAQEYADDIVDIATQAAQDAEDALRDLERDYADARTQSRRAGEADDRKILDDQQKDELEFRRDEAKALRDHLEDLLRIRREAQLREFELILNRDFAGLLLSRLKTNSDLQDANSDFTNKRLDEAQKFRDKQDDAARERAIDARERAIALQQKLDDLRLGYQRESDDRALQRQRDEEKAKLDNERKLRDLDEQSRRELLQRQNAFNAEMAELARQAGERINRIAEEQKIVNDGLGGIVSLFGSAAQAAKAAVAGVFLGSSITVGGGGSGTRYLENGGHLGAFEAATVQERRPEGFNGIPFPTKGQGVFIPFQAGFVNRNRGGNGGGGNTIAPTFNIYETQNPEATAAAIDQRFDLLVNEYFLKED